MAFTKVVGAGIHTLSNITSHNINSSGIITATKFVGPIEGDITAVDATFTGNVSIAKTLTYEDVKNVDSVGVGTFRDGIFIPDEKRIRFGNTNTSPNFSIYSTPTYKQGVIDYTHSGTGRALRIRATVLQIENWNGLTPTAKFIGGVGAGHVELNYAGNKKFETTSSGVSIGGTTIITPASGGKLGVGTDNPTFELDLRKTGQADLLIGSYNAGGARLMLDGDSNGDGSGGDFCEIMADTGGDLTINARNPASDAEMIFKTGGGTEKLRIDSDGNVIIKRGADVGNIIQMTGADTTSEILEAGIVSGNVQFTASYAIGGNNSCGFIFRTRNGSAGTAERLRIAADGKVGIGTNNPSHPVHILGADPQIKIQDSANNSHAQIFLDGPNSNLNFDWVSGSQRNINLINSGNGAIRVGIGITNPTERLDVDGTVKATNFEGGLPITNGADNRIVTCTSASAIRGETGLTYNGTAFSAAANSFIITNTNGNVTQQLNATSGDAKIVLENSGNDNYSAIDFERERSSGAGVNGGSIFMKSDTSSNNAYLYIQAQSASAAAPTTSALSNDNGVRLILKGGDGIFSVETGDSENLRIDPDGRCIVGGGTHAGGSALVVKGGNQNNYSTIGMFSNHTNPSDDTLLSQIRFGSNTSAVGADLRIYADDDWGNNDYPSRMEFYTAPNGSNDRKKRLAINSTGNIGINCGKTNLEAGVDIGTSDLSANSNTPLIIGTETGQNRFLKVNFFSNQQNFHSLTLRCNDNGIMNQLDISNPDGGAGYGSGIRFTGHGNDIGGKIEMINHTADNAAKMYMRFKAAGNNERMRIDQNGKVIVASGTLHSTRVLARFGIDCHGMNIYDGVGVVANYGMAFYNDPNTNYANGIGFFNDDGQTCGGYIVHQDKGGGNVGDIIMATSATSNDPVERLRIASLGNIKQNLSSPSGTSPFQNTHWYDRQGGHYTLTAIDDNYLSATKTDSVNGYNDIVYKRVRMSKNCDIEFELSGNSPAGIYRHVGFVINGDGTATSDNWDRLVFRSRPGNTANNQIRIDKGGGGYGFNEQSSDIPTFFDGTERHILIQLRDRLVNVIVDGEVIISQKTDANFNRSQGWFGFGIYEGGESANVVIRNLTIKNKFIQPHWLVRATGVNVDVSNGSALPFNQVIKASSDMSNSSHYNNSSYRFNVPISGMYYVFVRAYRNSSTSDEVAFYVNGSVRNRFKPKPNSGDYIFAGSSLIQLLKGEYIDVRAHGSGSFDNFYGNSDQNFSSWGGHLID